MNGTQAGVLALLLSLSLLGPACSSGGGASLTEIEQALEDCTRDGVIDLVRVLGNLGELFDAAEGDPIGDNLTFTPTANPNEFSYTLTFPLGGNGPDDTSISGLVSFSADPSLGIQPGSTGDLTGTITSLGGGLTGSFDLDLTFGTGSVSMTGTMMLDNGTCDFDITLTAADPLVLVFDTFVERQLAANFLGLEVSGTLQVVLDVLGANFEAIITLLEGDQNASVSGDLNGEPLDPFSVEVFPSPNEVQSLLFCYFFGLEAGFDIINDLGDVYAAIGDPMSFPNIDVQPGSVLGTFDFTGDFGPYTVTGTFTIPASPNGTGSAVFTFTSVTPMIVGIISEFNGSGNLSINFVNGEPESLYGTASVTTNDGCDVSFTIDQDNPMVLEGEPFSSGVVTFTVSALGNTLTLVFDFDAMEGEDEVLDADINGISIPGEFFFFSAR